MLLLGFLSVIQVTFLPGYILLSHLKLKGLSLIENLLYIFAFSLFLNYSLVTILTLSGIYHQTLIYFIIIIEILYIIYLSIAHKSVSFSFKSFREYLLSFAATFMQFSKSKALLYLIASMIVLFYFSLIISNTGTIFYFVDPVNLIHLNTWAIDFANNILPQQSSHFPQLIPANWSITYLMIGESNVHFFPKFIMPFFFFGNVLIFIDLAMGKRNVIYVTGLVIYGLFAPIIYSLVFIADGTADLPVSFFAFLTFYKFLKIDNQKFVLLDHLLLFLFASMTAATKLAGFYTFTIASIYSLFVLIYHWKSIKKSDLIIIALSVITIISISHFWYLLKPAAMVSGLHQPQWVGDDYYEIFTSALKLMYYNWGLPVFAFFIITILSSLFDKKIRYVTLIMVIPPIIIWMFKFSDDFRNLSFVVPFISYVTAYGLKNIIEKALNKNINLTFFKSGKYEINLEKLWIVGGIISLICITLYFLINTEYFYNAVYDIYKFISITYFQSHRINLLTDTTPFTSIDYYQRTIGVMLLLIPSIFLLSIFNVKIKHFFLVLMITVVVLNFSLIDKESILRHQEKSFEIVDARNYGAMINMIANSSELDNTIYTNFKTIIEDDKTKKLKFVYKTGNELTNLMSTRRADYLFFLKMELLSLETIKMINELGTSSKLNILFYDGEFILFIKKKNEILGNV